jgi:alkanesulfonate monooxygenase SsuD/methylene tetrahydromethanopterin reductase-like flavin-dependent oxidoreductase (luciferase family)
MEFGVFDHLDRSTEPLGEHYENRLKLIEAYDRLGIHRYHLAEHHATPLGLGACDLARSSTRLRCITPCASPKRSACSTT